MSSGSPYEKVKKVYPDNILYYDIENGKDYVYRGSMEFRGIHHFDRLALSKVQQRKFSCEFPTDLFPEIILIKVNNFDTVARSTLDEWIYFFKNTELPGNYSAKGLKQLEQNLNYHKMEATTQKKYDDYMTSVKLTQSMLDTATLKGRDEGRDEGCQKVKEAIILKLHDLGQNPSAIAEVVEMEEDEVIEFLRGFQRIK